MITRIWHGWTTPANAPVYEKLLRSEIFTGIAARGIEGYRGISLCKRESGEEVELLRSCGSTRLTPSAPSPGRLLFLRKHELFCRDSIRFRCIMTPAASSLSRDFREYPRLRD
jgi:hypothetical protein